MVDEIFHKAEPFQTLISQVESHAKAGRTQELTTVLEQLRTKAEQEQDAAAQAAAYFYSGLLAHGAGALEDCAINMKKVLEIAGVEEIPYFAMRAHNALGAVYSAQADFFISLSHYLPALHIATRYPEYLFESITLNNIGNLFVWLDEYEVALNYLLQSYESYMECQINRRPVLATLIINIIEVYTCLNDEANVTKWEHNDKVEWDEEERIVLQCILCSFRAVVAFRTGQRTEMQKNIRIFLERAPLAADFIYIFRSSLNIWRISIESGDCELATLLKERLEALSQTSSIHSFNYAFSDLMIAYNRTFFKQDPILTNESFTNYYRFSKQAIAQLRQSYARSLMMELELDQSRDRNQEMTLKNEELQRNIECDVFTGLLNKVAIERQVTEALSQGNHGTAQAIALLDIDHFKQVNDLFGHDVGDEVIIMAANVLKELCGEVALLGRFGGDEFLVFFPRIFNVSSLTSWAEEACRRAHDIPLPEPNDRKLTFSIGLCNIQSGTCFSTAFKQVDHALYKAKAQGRDRFALWSGE